MEIISYKNVKDGTISSKSSKQIHEAEKTENIVASKTSSFSIKPNLNTDADNITISKLLETTNIYKLINPINSTEIIEPIHPIRNPPIKIINKTYTDYGLTFNANPEIAKRSKKIKKAKPDNKPSLAFDIPKNIERLKHGAKGFEALITWENREDGTKLQSTWILTKELRKYQKLSRMLLNYYESIIQN